MFFFHTKFLSFKLIRGSSPLRCGLAYSYCSSSNISWVAWVVEIRNGLKTVARRTLGISRPTNLVPRVLSLPPSRKYPGFSRGNKYLFWSIFVSMPDGVRRSSDLYCPIRKNYELARKNERSVFKF